MVSITGEAVSQTITGKTVIGTVYTSKGLVFEVSSSRTHLKASIQVKKETRRADNTETSIDTFSTASRTWYAFHVLIFIETINRNTPLSILIHLAIRRFLAGSTNAIKIAV